MLRHPHTRIADSRTHKKYKSDTHVEKDPPVIFTKMNHSAALFQPLVENEDNDEEMSECKIFHGQFGPLFHAGSLCLGLAFAMPQWLKFQKVYLRY